MPQANQSAKPVKPEQGQLGASVERSVKRYLKDLNGTKPSGVYQMVLNEIEKPLLAVVMQHTAHNMSEAAKMLGMHPHTLRRKLERHGLSGLNGRGRGRGGKKA